MVTHYEGEFIKSKMSLKVRLETLYPDPGVQGAPKGGLVGFWSLSHAFWRMLYQTKVAGHPQLSRGRSPFRTSNPDLEGPGVLLEPWSLTYLINIDV